MAQPEWSTRPGGSLHYGVEGGYFSNAVVLTPETSVHGGYAVYTYSGKGEIQYIGRFPAATPLDAVKAIALMNITEKHHD